MLEYIDFMSMVTLLGICIPTIIVITKLVKVIIEAMKELH